MAYNSPGNDSQRERNILRAGSEALAHSSTPHTPQGRPSSVPLDLRPATYSPRQNVRGPGMTPQLRSPQRRAQSVSTEAPIKEAVPLPVGGLPPGPQMQQVNNTQPVAVYRTKQEDGQTYLSPRQQMQQQHTSQGFGQPQNLSREPISNMQLSQTQASQRELSFQESSRIAYAGQTGSSSSSSTREFYTDVPAASQISSSGYHGSSYPLGNIKSRQFLGSYVPSNPQQSSYVNYGGHTDGEGVNSGELDIPHGYQSEIPNLESAAAAAAAANTAGQTGNYALSSAIDVGLGPHSIVTMSTGSMSSPYSNLSERVNFPSPLRPHSLSNSNVGVKSLSGNSKTSLGSSKSILKSSKGPIRSVAPLSGSSSNHAHSRSAGGSRTNRHAAPLTCSVTYIPGLTEDTHDSGGLDSTQQPHGGWYWGLLPRSEDGAGQVGSPQSAIPIQLCEPPLRNHTPPNQAALKADPKKGSRKKSKYTAEQDKEILYLKSRGYAWKEIALRTKISKTISARNRYQVLIGQQGGGGYNWGEGEVPVLQAILDEAERAKWDFIARELTKSRGKDFTPDMCHYKIAEMFAKNPTQFGVCKSRTPFIDKELSEYSEPPDVEPEAWLKQEDE